MIDSGGIQEECTAPNIRKKCFVLRTSTERQEAVDAGFAKLVGVESERALWDIMNWWHEGTKVPTEKSPFGDGKTAERSIRYLKDAGHC